MHMGRSFKGKSVEFSDCYLDKPSVVRQPNAQRILKPSVLGKPTPFSNSPEMRNIKFLGTVRFGNDQFAPILGYGDLIQGNVTIKRVYYVEGLNHNLFSVGQFCDADLEVAFRKSTCFVRDLQGNDLLTDGENLDKMKEKGDPCVMVGYSTQSKGYRVYNKRTRLIVESIHIKFDEIKEKTFDRSSSSLGPQRQMVSAENNTSGPVPQCQMTFEHNSSSLGLVLHQMTSDHNRSELGIQDHSNEPSSSKLVPKVIPLAVKTAISRQELELLFHLHIAMLRTTGK
ncbi:hypothetical protein Tco_1168888 [Tanacetum coccineum]